jgi:hypothetical protein
MTISETAAIIIIFTTLMASWVRIVATARRSARRRIAAWERVGQLCRIAKLEHNMQQPGHNDGSFHPRDWNGLGTQTPYIPT